ncbi:paraquat-inducible protein A [Oceanibacterium hippocampi]|uniref:Paraquat-inducible protein A n=1 Tax=Oceanibacterium hippocampi TaxID=745714 RepID=A0A1Y5SEN9_9PROT|nr:paraquat-inducible protein A [Oceanibacterium hippocampi]SLN39038.1 Paraquat-inducible protein A [Oceanibacterium hippocampi]
MTSPPAPATAPSLAGRAAGLDRALGPALVLAAGLLVAGVALPFVQVERFFIFTDQYSLLSAIGRLAAERHFLLAFVVGLFSLVFPLVKLAAAGWLWFIRNPADPGFARLVHRLEAIGKWSMLDVFVAALLVFSLKASAVADARLAPGLYLFVAAILLSMLAVTRIGVLARRHAGDKRGNGG